MANLVSYGSYIPCWRLARADIGAALGTPTGRGERAVAAYDEDTTTMGVEASRRAISGAPDGYRPGAVVLVTPAPAYADRTNATALRVALGLDGGVGAYDFGGTTRSGAGAIRAALASSESQLVVCSELRDGLAGGADETNGGDAAVAFAYDPAGEPLAEVLSQASVSAEFTDRWRDPGASTSRLWEERFGERVYGPALRSAFEEALDRAGLTAGEVDHLVVAGMHARAIRSFVRSVGLPGTALIDDRARSIGNTGVAHAPLLLADALDRAVPGDSIVVLQAADGADATVLRAAPALVAFRENRGERDAQAARVVSYPTFLTWRDRLRREPPRRPEPDVPAAPPSWRNAEWKFGFVGSRCEACGTRHLPPCRVCFSCGAVDRMAPERLADAEGTVATFTIDRLAYSMSPPVVAAMVDLDDGGRFQAEVADADPEAIAIGGRVRMTFRRLYTASNGLHNYFWKARLVEEAR